MHTRTHAVALTKSAHPGPWNTPLEELVQPLNSREFALPTCSQLAFGCILEASWALRREREALSSLFLQDPHCPRPRRLSLGVFWLSDVCLLGGEALFFRQESGALFRSRFIFPALKFQFCLDRLPMHELGQAINIQALFADTGFSSIFQKRTKAHY